MKTLEFTSKVTDNRILIPERLRSAFKTNTQKNVRVIVLFDEMETEKELRLAEQTHFFEGYAPSDSIYDE